MPPGTLDMHSDDALAVLGKLIVFVRSLCGVSTGFPAVFLAKFCNFVP